MVNRRERSDVIVKLLRERGAMRINDLADALGVSHMTVRRDVDRLIEENRVQRYHGGVRLSSIESRVDYDLKSAEYEHRAEKEAIARRASTYINPGDTVFLDAGTTTELIARSIPEDQGITVVSMALNIIAIAAEKSGVRVIGGGGVYHESSGVFDGPETVALLNRTRTTIAFLSANAVQFELGVTCSNSFEVAGKQAAMRSSLRSVLVVDSSKLGHVVSEHFANLEDFASVIMDAPGQSDVVEKCRRSGVRFNFVDVDDGDPAAGDRS